MTESPNDSDSVKELRNATNQIKKLFNDLEQMYEDLEHPLQVQEDLECQIMIAKKLLRTWMKSTEREFFTDERQSLVKLTNRLLDGI